MIRPSDPYEGSVPLHPSPVALAAVVESVVSGLVARHAFHEGLPAAAWLVLTFLFLLPAAVGYRTVAASDERMVGVLPPSAILLMMLSAGVAVGGAGVLGTLLLMPLFMLMALLGGVLTLMVRGTCQATTRMAAWLTRAPRSLRREVRGDPAWRASAPRTMRDRARPVADSRDAWQQIIIRTPL